MLNNDPSIRQQQHQMQLEKTHPSGAQEWVCPTCARRFLMQLQPELNTIVLEAGNEHVRHVGSTDGLQLRLVRVHQGDEPVLSDELRAALEEALEDVDFDDWFGMADC